MGQGLGPARAHGPGPWTGPDPGPGPRGPGWTPCRARAQGPGRLVHREPHSENRPLPSLPLQKPGAICGYLWCLLRWFKLLPNLLLQPWDNLQRCLRSFEFLQTQIAPPHNLSQSDGGDGRTSRRSQPDATPSHGDNTSCLDPVSSLQPMSPSLK